jgi:hypothetical protein
VVTNLVTQQPGLAWSFALIILVVVGSILQMWLTFSQGEHQGRQGPASVSVKGTSRAAIYTRASKIHTRNAADRLGPAAVEIGNDAHGEIRTEADDLNER